MKLFLFRCIKVLAGHPWYLAKRLLYFVFQEMLNPAFHTQAQKLQIWDFFGVRNKCELCSASVKRQDHPGLNWRRPFHHHIPNLHSALYPQEKCKIPLLLPLHPFSGGCFFGISIWAVEWKERQESLILEGRKFVLTESGEEHSPEEWAADLRI